MSGVLAQLVDGELDVADVLLLVAAVLFLAAAVVRFLARSIDSALVALGLTATALAWLVL